jgi:Ribosomal protein L23
LDLSLAADDHFYSPDFVVTLIRTPSLPPKYASFWVPLWFNKLDFKNYLKNVYNVDVLHIRSFVKQQKVEQEERQTLDGIIRGRFSRPPAKKKMTVELVDPFVYPDEEKDLSPYATPTTLFFLYASRTLTDTDGQMGSGNFQTRGERAWGDVRGAVTAAEYKAGSETAKQHRGAGRRLS